MRELFVDTLWNRTFADFLQYDDGYGKGSGHGYGFRSGDGHSSEDYFIYECAYRDSSGINYYDRGFGEGDGVGYGNEDCTGGELDE